MNRIGIMGGTFNPIHLGHIALAKAAYEQYELDKVLFVPSGISYMKKGMNILGSEDRCNLVFLSIADYPCFALDRIEVDRPGNSYTWETLNKLKNRENADYFFICGADTLFMIEKWLNPEYIMKNCTLLVAVRDEYDMDSLENKASGLRERYNASIDFIRMDSIDISSTNIRNRIAKGEHVSGLLDSKAIKYIEERGLYQNA